MRPEKRKISRRVVVSQESDADSDEVEYQTQNSRSAPKSRRLSGSNSQTQGSIVPQASDDEVDRLDFTQRDIHNDSQLPSSSQIDDEDDGEEPARIASMNDKIKQDLIAKTVRYLVVKASSNTPIKLGDLTKDVFKDHRNVARHFLQIAAKSLESVFGYKVVPADDFSSSSTGKKDVFLIINAISDQQHLLKVLRHQGKRERGLLMMILGFIWCSPSRRLTEDLLWKNLSLLDKSIRAQKHPHFGDLTLLIKTFESQLYLSVESEIDADGKKVKSYTFGPRTMAEVGKARILTFVCKMINGRHPSAELLQELEHEDKV